MYLTEVSRVLDDWSTLCSSVKQDTRGMAFVKLLLILACATSFSMACSCFPEHPQQQFCKSDFVVAVRVTSQPRSQVMPNSNIPMLFQAYELRLLAIFKDDEKAIKANSRGFNKVSLYTAPAFPSSSCSVTLQLGSFYVLSGKFKDGNLYTRFCDRREKWTDFSETRLTELRERYRNYSKGCECWIGPFCFLYPKSRCGLRGCNGYDVNIDFACRKTFQRCEKLDETKCAWTGRRCDRNLKEMP